MHSQTPSYAARVHVLVVRGVESVRAEKLAQRRKDRLWQRFVDWMPHPLVALVGLADAGYRLAVERLELYEDCDRVRAFHLGAEVVGDDGQDSMPGFCGQTSLLLELATRTLVEGLALLEPTLDVVLISARHKTAPQEAPRSQLRVSPCADR